MEKSIKELAKELQRKAHTEWQRKNKDKCKIYIERYWEKKAKEIYTGGE